MVRALIYVLLLITLSFLFVWVAENPGVLTLDWGSYSFEVGLVVYIAVLIVGTALLLFLLGFLLSLISTPGRLKRYLSRRRQEKGYAALRRGIFAVGAGDETTAARYAIEARRALKDEPLTALLQAQSAQLSGDHRTAQRVFEAMSERPETRLIGLRGLFMEASREGQMEAARQYAARAVALNPTVPWPVHALFDLQCRARDWQGALETLAVARNHRHINRRTHDRRRAVLLTAQAQELEESDAARAADLALEAHRLVPNFVPAAAIAGRVMAGQGQANRAARVLARTWQYTPHPDLAVSYAYARPGDSPHDRLDRIRSLIVMTPDDAEARIALATAAVDARDWAEAREALEPLIEDNPSTRVCALMARIEGGENRDAGRVREWLARAVRAPRDPVWMADGVVSAEWQPTSPVTGQLDAFEWRVPPHQVNKTAGDPLFDEVTALSQELQAVARKISQGAADVEDEANATNGGPLTITVRAEERTASAPSQEEPPKPSSVAGTAAEAVSPGSPVTRQADAVASVSGNAHVQREAVAAEPEMAEPASSAKFAPAASGDASAAGDAGRTDIATEGDVEPPKAGVVKSQTEEKQKKKTPPEIFVPSRPPDDPGPEPNDYDETNTPYSRYRNH